MHEIWTITNEDAENIMNFLQVSIDEYENAGMEIPGFIESVKNVHAALMWADRIEIEG